MASISSTDEVQKLPRKQQPVPFGVDRWLIQAWLAPVMQQALREAKENGTLRQARRNLLPRGSYFRTLAEEAPVGIFCADDRGRCVYVNPRWSEMTGLPRHDAQGGGWIRALHPEDRDWVVGRWHRWVTTGEPMRDEFRFLRADGSVTWVLSQGAAIYDDNHLIAGYVGTLSDITEHKYAQDALIESKNTFARQLLRAQEEERQRIARELHDEMGQMLTALKLELQEIQGEPISPRQRLSESIGMVDQIMEQMRALLTDLRPAPLETLGLPAALRWYITRQTQRTGLKISFHATNLPNRLPAEIEVSGFRIVQEALTNVVRHAHAQQVTVELRQEEAALVLSITDDGIGFDVGAARRRAAAGQSLGMIGMHERAELAGGRLSISSVPVHGTRIQVQFPLHDQ
jgi:PAS domain S-box-containing protein